jgi:FAD:protein FMN transferase
MTTGGTARHPLAIAAYVVVLFILSFLLVRELLDTDDDTATRTQIALGTVIEMQVRGMQRDEADRAMTAAFQEIHRIDTLFSTYIPDAPVWKLNRAGGEAMSVPDELLALLHICNNVRLMTHGAFDIAVDALVQVWGFDSGNATVPESGRLQQALDASGWRHVEMLDDGRVRLNAGAGLNFGAIAKGYAVDKAIAVLRSYGVIDGLVNAGGDVHAFGSPWTVGIQDPRDTRALSAAIRLENRSAATSGDYERYFEENGFRYHHIFDPVTGQPARGCRSVTVLARDNTTADAIATAVFVMGPSKGMDFLLQNENIEGMIIDDRGEILTTPGFDNLLSR